MKGKIYAPEFKDSDYSDQICLLCKEKKYGLKYSPHSPSYDSQCFAVDGIFYSYRFLISTLSASKDVKKREASHASSSILVFDSHAGMPSESYSADASVYPKTPFARLCAYNDTLVGPTLVWKLEPDFLTSEVKNLELFVEVLMLILGQAMLLGLLPRGSSTRFGYLTVRHGHLDSDTYFTPELCSSFKIVPSPTLGHVSVSDTSSRVWVAKGSSPSQPVCPETSEGLEVNVHQTSRNELMSVEEEINADTHIKIVEYMCSFLEKEASVSQNCEILYRYPEAIGPQKAVGPNKKCEPKPYLDPTLILEAPAIPDKERSQGAKRTTFELEKSCTSDSRQVIIPQHIHVPEVEKLGLIFGGLDANFGSCTIYPVCPEKEKSPPIPEISEGMEENADQTRIQRI